MVYAIGANIATAAGPNAPAVVGVAATKNMTHGIIVARSPTSRASELTNHSIVPFTEAIPITGLIVTQIDGKAKGGIVLAVHEALDIPVKFIGVGEKATDLEAFDPKIFAREVLEG